MTIEIVNDKDLWDRFIYDSPYGMLFHRWDFLKIIEKHTGYHLLTYGVYKGEELIGVIPMFYKKTMGVKLVYSPPQGTLAYIPYMGLVMSNAYAGFSQRKKELYLDMAWSDISHELKKLSANYASITFPQQMDDVRPFIWDGYKVLPLHTYMLDLDKPLKMIWDDFEKDCKRKISDATKSGLSIERTYDVEALFNLMIGRLTNVNDSETFFHRQSPDYVKDMLITFPHNIKMYVVYSGSQLVGAKVNYEYKDRCVSWMGNMAVNGGVSASEYVTWELVKKAKEAGYKWYEIWGGDIKRLNMFKSKFNPVLVPYYHIEKKDAVGKLADLGYGMINSRPSLRFVKKMIT